ncbi:hypothetical protein [Viridibacterium curvum]|uniref:Lipoprotein n=1 Tax=Viridibacterium curvum TaxID=1101404 RepID=A0ABP9Q676_9RHOO
MNKLITACAVVCVMLLSACSSAPVRLGNVTDASQIDFSKGGERIEVFSRGFQLFGFIPLNINTRHEVAYEELKQLAGDRFITDVRVEESWKYAIVGTFFTTVIRATVYPRLPQAAAQSAPAK